MPAVFGPTEILRFGSFVLDPSEQSLAHEGARLTVEPKVLDALHHLARRPDALVTREELLASVWPDVVVSDDSVSQVIRKVRSILGDSTRRPRWVATGHGKGYRFIGAVSPDAPAPRPVQLAADAFVGREDLLDAIGEALAPKAVVTLIGPGGIGKTRLSLEYMDRSRARWGEHVWFVACAGARSGEELASAVAGALGVPLTADVAPVEHLAGVLATRPPGLLVLDNVEQVIRAARDLLAACLTQAPHFGYLVSSRVPVGLSAERRLLVGPLGPAHAARLFAARARSAGDVPDEAVERLVEGLEGDPLSIELAAARSAVLSTEHMAERLDERLDLLGRRRDDRRHGNLRNNLAWTWDLLDEDQKELLEQCAGFRGGFSVDTAENVVRLPSGTWPGDVVLDLAECGLLRPDRVEGPQRLHMAEALRLFCEERVEQRADRVALGERQARVLADLGERLAQLYRRGEEEGRTLAAWLADLRVALDHALPDHPDTGARIALALHEALSQSGPHAEVCRHLERALAAGPGAEHEARLLCARLYYPMGEEACARMLERSRALEEGASPEVRADLLHARAWVALREGRRDEALRLLDEALPLVEGTGRSDMLAMLLCLRANALRTLGRHDEATRAASEALAAGRLSPRIRAAAVQAKALADHRGGRIRDALRGIDELAELVEQLGDRRGRLMVASFRAIHGLETGNDDLARRSFDEALTLVREIGDEGHEARLLVNLTAKQIFDGQWEAATGTARRGRALAVRAGDQEGEVVAAVNLAVARIMAGDPAEALEALEALAERPSGRYVGWALLWRAVAEAELGRLDRARRSLDEARAALGRIDDPTAPPCLALAEALLVSRAGERDRARAMSQQVQGEETHKRELLLELLHRHV